MERKKISSGLYERWALHNIVSVRCQAVLLRVANTGYLCQERESSFRSYSSGEGRIGELGPCLAEVLSHGDPSLIKDMVCEGAVEFALV